MNASFWQKEPAIIIGALVSVIIAVVGALTDQGIISEVASGRATDIVNAGSSLIITLLPLITGILIRPAVYSPSSYNKK